MKNAIVLWDHRAILLQILIFHERVCAAYQRNERAVIGEFNNLP